MKIDKYSLFLAMVLLLSACGGDGIESTSHSEAAPALTDAADSGQPATDQTSPVIERPADGIYIIFDASGSMWGQLPDRSTKLNVAKKVLNEFVGGDFSGYDLAMRVYGHRHKDDCEDSELVVPFGPPDQVTKPMREFVAKTNALGRTPITYSLQQALTDFGDRAGEIILITDGIESCDADPCSLIRQWRETNVKIKVHVVGFGLDEKSKDALKCLSDATGTDYFDAQSAKELSEALKKIREKAAERGVVLKGFDPSGKEVLTHGTLSRNGAVAYKIRSNGRFLVEPGEYELTAGVQTRNGNIYRPTTKKVQVSGTTETLLRVEVALPPRVRAAFKDTQAEERRGSLITIWQNGQQFSTFRPIDEVFLDEGTYEFRANPQNTGEVSVTESLSAGDRKEIRFELARVVKIFVSVRADGSDHVFRKNVELWQDGVKKYTVHQANGALVQPGTYTIVVPDDLIPYEQTNVTVANRNDQKIDVAIPVGFVTFVYHKADGTPDKSVNRVFLSRPGDGQRIYKRAFEPIPLIPGSYVVTGWSQRGYSGRVPFDVGASERKQIVITR